jgi:hypothetical protein
MNRVNGLKPEHRAFNVFPFVNSPYLLMKS